MKIKKEKNYIPAAKLALHEKLVETNPGIKRKGATVPYTSHDGHMFTFLSGSGLLAIRLPEKERENFVKKYNTKLMVAYGVVMKEYV